uniref:SUN domain-containing protein n=1 Tax=Globisporangium ultimum (strain ATCC 200006 / CBS 805.95 / DAOM BR144) TaxID=431595 RepID=K3XC05_GLOUD
MAGSDAQLRSLVADTRTSCRVSSVLDRNRTLYGGEHMLSRDATTCWNSAQGSPQHVLLQFHERVVDVAALDIMFQGGFVGQDVELHVKKAATEQWERVADADIDPQDCNELQTFACHATRINALRLSFSRSTDFYGRVIIYRLDVMGNDSSADNEGS